MKRIICSFLFLLTFIFTFSSVEAADWVYVCSDKLDNEYYINTKTITTTKDSQFKVLYKEKLSSLGKEDFQAIWSDEYTNIEYVCFKMEWLEFRKKNGIIEVKVLSRSVYNSEGKFIGKLHRPYAFHKVDSNSIYMKIYKESSAAINNMTNIMDTPFFQSPF